MSPKCPCKNGYWLDNPISYQLHHINGKHDDNTYRYYVQIVILKQIIGVLKN